MLVTENVLKIFKMLEENKEKSFWIETKDGKASIVDDFSFDFSDRVFCFHSIDWNEIYSVTNLDEVKSIYTIKTVKHDRYIECAKGELLLEL